MKPPGPRLALVVASAVARADFATDIRAIVDAEMAARRAKPGKGVESLSKAETAGGVTWPWLRHDAIDWQRVFFPG